MDQAKASYHADETKAQAEEKTNQMLDNVRDRAEKAMDSMQQTGEQVKAAAQGAADAIKGNSANK